LVEAERKQEEGKKKATEDRKSLKILNSQCHEKASNSFSLLLPISSCETTLKCTSRFTFSTWCVFSEIMKETRKEERKTIYELNVRLFLMVENQDEDGFFAERAL